MKQDALLSVCVYHLALHYISEVIGCFIELFVSDKVSNTTQTFAFQLYLYRIIHCIVHSSKAMSLNGTYEMKQYITSQQKIAFLTWQFSR
jgi:hypothetical protein